MNLRRASLLALLAASLAAVACGAHRSPAVSPGLDELRRVGATTKDPEVAALLLVRELVSPGGDATRAAGARVELDSLGQGGMISALARGLDDSLHGRLGSSGEHYLEAVRAARDSKDARAPLIAWFAANRAASISSDAPDLWNHFRSLVLDLIASPRNIGWRARSELVEWSIDESWAEGARDLDQRAIALYGCLTSARLAGPFGHGAPTDAVRHFAPEDPLPWPYRWDPDPGVAKAPRLLSTSSHSCAIQPDEKPGDGIYYAEAFFDLPAARDVLIAVQGALLVRVDDAVVLDRDVRTWGVWPRFGVHLKLGAGRHRIVARLGEPATSIRVLAPDGTPIGVVASKDTSAPYDQVPPVVVDGANVLDRWVHPGGVSDPGDDLTRVLAAFVAHVDSSDDVASVMMAPLIDKIDLATGPSLSLAATFVDNDPIFDSSQSDDLVRELHERAEKKDPKLWASRLSLALGVAEKKGAEEAVPELERLAAEFTGVPDVILSLARIYGELGWTPEHSRTVKQLLARFPNDLGALHAAVDVYDAEGDAKTVDELVGRIQRLDRDDEIVLTRALAREDYGTAIAELERLSKLHPDRKDLAERLYDAKVRAGDDRGALAKLEAAVKKDPTDPHARLDLSDARYASGDDAALRHGLADGVQAGANTSLLTSAIDLVEGVTELEPYRLDARKIIAAYEKSGRHMEGTAARILDYSALWVHADGSSRMLEHEIVRLQSEEAISSFAEHPTLEGLVLHMRVIKKDGSTLEPEFVAGKPTVTFPHLEVGDYIETEQVIYTPNDGHPLEYLGPRWFFREENVGYARSEFVVISPSIRNLVVETTGDVPAPQIETHDGFVTRRWRVDYSPAAPTEPGSAPITEFLPSVQIGWGVTLEERLRAIGDALAQITPVDPRIRKVAEHIVEPLPQADEIGRARKLYRWLLDNVENGDETDPRRIIIGKRGNLWHGFRMLCRALGIEVRYAVAENRLAPPPHGPFSEATLFTQPVAEIQGQTGRAWLTLGSKYAPFGYLSADVRGMPAYFVDGARERTTVPEQGAADGIAFSGHGRLDASGSLELELVEQFSGKLAMALRRGLSQVPEQQLHEILESNLLAQTLHGGSLENHTIEHRDDYDVPLVIRMTVHVARFAQRSGKDLIITPPLSPDFGRLATLPSRQTPLLIPETLHRDVDVTIDLPSKATASGLLPATITDGKARVAVTDSTSGNVLRLTRSIDIPAGRIQPAEYEAFARFAHASDDAVSREIRVTLP